METLILLTVGFFIISFLYVISISDPQEHEHIFKDNRPSNVLKKIFILPGIITGIILFPILLILVSPFFIVYGVMFLVEKLDNIYLEKKKK